MLAYGGAVTLAVVLLLAFHSRAWYWHTASLALAFVLAYLPYPLMQLPQGPATDLLVGCLILFALFWGLGGLITLGFTDREHHKHA